MKLPLLIYDLIAQLENWRISMEKLIQIRHFSKAGTNYIQKVNEQQPDRKYIGIKCITYNSKEKAM